MQNGILIIILVSFSKPKPKPKNPADPNAAVQAIWNDLPDETIRKSALSFRKQLMACITAEGGHFKHSIN